MKYLFIGGPADGRSMEIDCQPGNEPPYYAVPDIPKNSELHLTAEEFARIDGILKKEITVHHYKKETLCEGIGPHKGHYPVYVSSEVTSLIRQLLIGYQRKQK